MVSPPLLQGGFDQELALCHHISDHDGRHPKQLKIYGQWPASNMVYHDGKHPLMMMANALIVYPLVKRTRANSRHGNSSSETALNA